MDVQEEQIATYAVGLDHLADNRYVTSGLNRMIVGIAFVGSAAAGDCAVDVFVGSQHVATLYNSTTGLGVTKDDVLSYRVPVPAGARLSAPVVEASATNPTRLLVQTVP